MNLLNPRGFFRRDIEQVVDERANLPASFSCQSHSDQAPLSGGSHSFEHVGGVPAGGKSQSHITLIPKGLDLPGKDMVEGRVIGDGSQGRSIRG